MKREEGPPSDEQTIAIDWEAIHRRLEAAQTALERGLEPTSEEKRKILRARAKALAQEMEKEQAEGESLEVVEFLLAYEHYAIESSLVREICPIRDITLLPGAPSFVLGIINVRGQIISVIDIKKFFNLPEKGLTDLNKVIRIHNGEMEIGILADLITGARSIPLSEIQPPLPTLTGICAEYLKGVTGERLVILDAETILADKRIVVHDEIEI